MKKISIIILLVSMIAALSSCDEDSGTIAPNGFRETGDRVKRVTINSAEQNNFHYGTVEYEYKADGSLDKIQMFYEDTRYYEKFIVTPEYEGADTNYAFTLIESNGDTLPSPINYLTIRWDGDTRYTDYYYDTYNNVLDSNKRAFNTITKYENGKMVENNIYERSVFYRSYFLHKYNFTYGDSTIVEYTRIPEGSQGYQSRKWYTVELSEAPNPFNELNLLGAFGYGYVDITLLCDYLVDDLSTEYREIVYGEDNETTMTREKMDYVHEYSAKGNLVRYTGPFITNNLQFDVEIEWEEAD